MHIGPSPAGVPHWLPFFARFQGHGQRPGYDAIDCWMIDCLTWSSVRVCASAPAESERPASSRNPVVAQLRIGAPPRGPLAMEMLRSTADWCQGGGNWPRLPRPSTAAYAALRLDAGIGRVQRLHPPPRSSGGSPARSRLDRWTKRRASLTVLAGCRLDLAIRQMGTSSDRNKHLNR